MCILWTDVGDDTQQVEPHKPLARPTFCFVIPLFASYQRAPTPNVQVATTTWFYQRGNVKRIFCVIHLDDNDVAEAVPAARCSWQLAAPCSHRKTAPHFHESDIRGYLARRPIQLQTHTHMTLYVVEICQFHLLGCTRQTTSYFDFLMLWTFHATSN